MGGGEWTEVGKRAKTSVGDCRYLFINEFLSCYYALVFLSISDHFGPNKYWSGCHVTRRLQNSRIFSARRAYEVRALRTRESHRLTALRTFRIRKKKRLFWSLRNGWTSNILMLDILSFWDIADQRATPRGWISIYWSWYLGFQN